MEPTPHNNQHREDADDRLDQIERRIRALEAELALEREGRGRRYYESGTFHPELDDQTIAP